MGPSVEADLAAIARIGAVPTILRTIRESTGLRFTFVARVLPDRWIACAVHDDIDFGLKTGGELDVATTLCSQVRDTRQAVIMDHASQDPVYAGHPTPKMYGFESYISVPLFRASGEYFGTVCGLDPEPLTVSDAKTRNLLTLFAQLISLQLDAEERHEQTSVDLQLEQKTAAVREEFIAVLGHDLRTPLSSIAMGTDLLLRKADAADRRLLERVRTSARRIGTLIDDLLDLARGRLSGGIVVQRVSTDALGLRLLHVVEELRATHPARTVHLRGALTGAVTCDPGRLEQLLQNLLANALEHGVGDAAIEVELTDEDDAFEIAVTNQGSPLSEETKSRLFQPYFRGGQRDQRSGLGLGLYIAAEIARAHAGTIAVASEHDRMTFRVRLPRG